MTKVVIFNIEHGVAWNPFGKTYPSPGQWVWSNDEVPAYMTRVAADGFAIILHGEDKRSKDAMEEMLREITSAIILIVGAPLKSILDIFRMVWSGRSRGFAIDQYLTADNELASLPPYPGIPGYELNEVEPLCIDALPQIEALPRPVLIIMMGQQGSGKSTFADSLRRLQFIIVKETEAGMIRRGQTKAVAEFKALLQKVKIEPTFHGVVVDATSPTNASRQVYAQMALAMGMPAIVAWCTRPGFRYNAMRSQPIPIIGLHRYASTLESPGLFDLPAMRVV